MLSIVLGLGVAQLLSSLASIIRGRERARLYAPLVFWLVFLVLAHVQTWWSMFGLRDHGAWSFATFVVVLLQPVLLFLLSALFTPEPQPDGSLDLEATYWRHARPFFALLLAVLLVSLGKDVALDERLPTTPNLAAHFVFMAQAVAALLWRNRLFHWIAAPLALAGLAVYVAALFAQLA